MIPLVYAGQRRHRVELQRKTDTSDGMGGTSTDWEVFAEPYARVRSVSARERLQADQLQSAVTHRALIRFVAQSAGSAMPYVFAGDRLVYRGVSFDIRAVIDIEERRRWLELDLESGVGA